MKKNVSGITLTSLVITIIVILILAGVTINTTTDLLYDSKVKTKITYLSLVQMTAENLYEKYSFENSTDEAELEKIDESNILSEKMGIYVKDENTTYLSMCNISTSETGWFKWDKQTLANNGLDTEMLDEDSDFFLVNYDSNEVAMSTANDGRKDYTLTDMLNVSN
jgi:Tfp pilus assembly protein PilE